MSTTNWTRIKIKYKEMAVVGFYCFDLWHLILMQLLPNLYAKTIATIGLWLVLLLAVSKYKSIVKGDAIFLLTVNFVMFIFSYFIHPEYGYAMFQMPTWNIYASVFTFSSGIFAYLFFRIETDPSELRTYLKPAAWLCFFWGLLRVRSALSRGGFTRIFENGSVSSGSYDMTVGYRFLFVCIVFLVLAMQEKHKGKKIFDCIMVVVSAILMMVFGSRTAVASLIFFWCMYSLLYQYEGKNVRDLTKRIGFILGLIVGYKVVTNQSILQFIAKIISGLGLGSRMLDTLIQGGVELDLGRNRLYEMVYEMIRENPIMGAGIYADRALGGIYCHQIILEFLLNFGVILGGVFLLIIAYYCMVMLFRCKNSDWKLLFMIFFSMCFIRLNVSSSYWCDTNFWVCVAIVVNYSKELRRGRVGLKNGS